jgi:hypothetical protein
MDSNKGGGLGSIFMLLTLLVGGVVLESQVALKGSRPTHDSKIHHHPLSEEDVDARMWQDPFQATDQFIKSHKKGHEHGDEPPLERWQKFKNNLERKSSALGKSEKIIVLGVMVSSGAYFVNAEDRIRTRYAVVSGLASSGYQSENSEYIGFLSGKEMHHFHATETATKNKNKTENQQHHHLPDRLPYEWFVKEDKEGQGKKEHVLVLWLDDRHFFHEHEGKKRPLNNIQILFQHLVAESNIVKETPANAGDHSHSKEKTLLKLEKSEYGQFRFAVIGPPHSGQLKEMVREVSKSSLQEFKQDLPAIQIFSTRATKDEQQILQEVLKDTATLSLWKYLKKWEFLNKRNILFLRAGPSEPKSYFAPVKGIEDQGKNLERVLKDSRELSIWDYFKKNNICFLRTTPIESKSYYVPVKDVENQGKVLQRVLEDSSKLSIGEHFLKKKMRFLRTTSTDLKLAQAVVSELTLRGITKKSPIALVSEWDTDYGRAFQKTMCKAWVEKFSPEENSPTVGIDACPNIHYFGYLRGLDGQIPEPISDEHEKDTKKGSPVELNMKTEDAANLRAERERQYDYLLRLAEKIKEIEKKLSPDKKVKLPAIFQNLHFEAFGIREGEMPFPPTMFQNPRFEAFGILGSDYYDKLVVLQALRKKFTHTNFFTTDMDARLFHGKDYKYVRNLIVASGFGLRLQDSLQKSIPPFRDTYQTSAYLATRIAINPDPSCRQATQEALDQWLQARVFEIGRTQAFDLSENRSPENEICDLLMVSDATGFSQEERVGTSLHPHPTPLFPPYKYPAFIVLTVVLVLLLCFKFKDHWKEIVCTTLVLGGFIVFAVLLDLGGSEEPLAFFEGVSLWSTDFFRLTGVVVAVVFILIFNKRFLASLDTMKDEYEHTKEEPRVDWYPMGSKKFFWEVSWRSVAFILTGSLVLLTFGLPFIPVRGEVSAIVDKITLGLFILAFGVSLFYAGVKLNESIDLIKKFKPGKWTWTDKTSDAVFKYLKASSTPKSVRPLLNDLISLRLIGLRTNVADELIYYPFGIIAIGILSRNRVFDNWDFPLTLLSIFGFGALYILMKAVQVQRAAKGRKDSVIGKLKIQQIYYKSQGQSYLEEMTNLLIEDTRNYRQGAFLPFMEHPFFKAMLLPFSGFGGMALLEYMFLAV